MKKTYELALTTQGPAYPPSEVMDQDGNFVVIGYLSSEDGRGQVTKTWGSALVSASSPLPTFGKMAGYEVTRTLNLDEVESGADDEIVLHTLPLPLACNNYPMEFAPEQRRVIERNRSRQPLHLAAIPDERPEDGRRKRAPITLRQWIKAKGELTVFVPQDSSEAAFDFKFEGLIPNSLYTVMALRERDLDPSGPTRPGPLGLPNVFITDENGHSKYQAVMPNPFPRGEGKNRIVNVVVLWMSTQMNYGGAIGYYGLGGDVHAQLKLKTPSFGEFFTEKDC